MGDTAKHHMAHLVELLFGGGIERRMIVAVAGTPPRRHTVDKLASVGKHQTIIVSRSHLICWQRIDCRCIRVPQMLAVPGIEEHVLRGQRSAIFIISIHTGVQSYEKC